MIIPRGRKRKGKRNRSWERDRQGEDKGSSEQEWEEVRSLLDPNPQLKGVELGKYAPKVISSIF